MSWLRGRAQCAPRLVCVCVSVAGQWGEHMILYLYGEYHHVSITCEFQEWNSFLIWTNTLFHIPLRVTNACLVSAVVRVRTTCHRNVHNCRFGCCSSSTTSTTSINDEICFNYVHKITFLFASSVAVRLRLQHNSCSSFIELFTHKVVVADVLIAYRIILIDCKCTYKWWIECRTVNTNAWIRILIGWRIRCAIDTDTGRRQSRVAGQSQTGRIILTRANCLARHWIGHNGTSIFATCWRWWHRRWCCRIVRCLRLSSRTDCTRLYTCCRHSTRTDWRRGRTSRNRWLSTGRCCCLAIATASQQLKWKVEKNTRKLISSKNSSWLCGLWSDFIFIADIPFQMKQHDRVRESFWFLSTQ